ncbi:hypothetical protein HHI36_007646 [Cryptolaemus montrouzieri]|uniref:Uncharacterized protein n=1 Tax=Cryptolaemus montrouzieri TaxID=559131 RepID=A0ABD2MQ62_9CUCU
MLYVVPRIAWTNQWHPNGIRGLKIIINEFHLTLGLKPDRNAKRTTEIDNKTDFIQTDYHLRAYFIEKLLNNWQLQSSLQTGKLRELEDTVEPKPLTSLNRKEQSISYGD